MPDDWWRDIPDAVLDADKRQQQAQQWGAQARAEVAQQWGDQARAEVMQSYPMASDLLTNPLGMQGTSAGPMAEPPTPSPEFPPPNSPTPPAPALPAPSAPLDLSGLGSYQSQRDYQTPAAPQAPAPDPSSMLDKNGVIAYVHQRAADFGLDPAAVLAVAAQEGLNTAPGSHWQLSGERNISFGPPSWYGNGAGAAILAQHGPNAASWSWTPPGIDYWLGQVAQAARGLSGNEAISAIVNKFERPREDLAAGEIKKAAAEYATYARPGTTDLSYAGPAPAAPDASQPPSPGFDFGQVLQQARDAVGQTAQQAADTVGATAQQAQRSFGDLVTEARQAVGSFGQSFSGLPASAQPTPSDTLTNPLGTGNGPQDTFRARSDQFQPVDTSAALPSRPSPAVVPALDQARQALLSGDTQAALDALGQAREAVATSAIGPALGALRGPALLSDEELLRNARPEQLQRTRDLLQRMDPTRPVTDAEVADFLRSNQEAFAVAMTHTGGGGKLPVPIASTPAATTAASSPGLTINLPKYIPEDVQQIIRQAYDANPQVMDAARRGVIPDDVVRQLAEQVGQSPAQIAARWRPGQAKNAETILALREGLNSASQRVLLAQRTLQANPQSADALNGVTEALTRHAAIQEAVTGVTAEAGRALRQFRQPVTGQQFAVQQIQRIARATHMAPEELAQHLANVDLADPGQVANLARTLTTHTFGDKLSAIWYFNLLSSPVTHLKNAVSNALVLASRPVESVASATVDLGLSAARRQPRQRYFGEAPAQVVGAVAGLQDAVKATYQVLRRGVPAVPEGGKLELVTREAFKGQVSAPLRRGDLLGAMQGVGGNVILAPGRALGASDAFFRTLNKSATLYGDAYRLASQEGARGRNLLDAVAQRVANPTAEMLTRADKEAAYRVFQQPSGFVDALARLRNQYPAIRVLLPFVQTPYNIAKYALERTPLAVGKMATEVATPAGRAELVAKGAGDLADRLGRAVLGSATLYTLYRYAEDGNLTAAAPVDPTAKDAFYRQGKQPYSMRNPVTGEWFSYAGLQPYTTIFAAAGTIADMLKGHPNQPAPDALTGIAVTSLALGRATLDQPWTQGLADFLDFMSGSRVQDAEDLFNATGKYAAQQATQIEPAVMRWLARAQDSTIREPGKGLQGVVGNLQAGIPGQSQNVPPRLTAFGQPSQRPASGLQTLNPFASSQPTSDPIEQELARLQLKGFSVQPGFVGKQVTVGTERIPLNDQERQAYQERAGVISYELLATAMTSKEWQGLNDVGKARVVDRLVQRGHEAAAKEIGQQPAVYQRAVESRQKHLAAATP